MGKGRAPCCDKNQVKRGPWSPAEDLRLITFIQNHGHDNWRALPKQAGTYFLITLHYISLFYFNFSSSASSSASALSLIPSFSLFLYLGFAQFFPFSILLMSKRITILRINSYYLKFDQLFIFSSLLSIHRFLLTVSAKF